MPFAEEGITATLAPRRYALLIGIDEFEDSRFSALEYAAGDARALAEAIDGFDEVRVLAQPRETSRAAIISALHDLERRVKHPQDTVLIYISSHGSLGRQPGGSLERFLVTGDTRLDAISETGIAINWLLSSVSKIRSRSKVVFLATCHAGAGKSQLSDEIADALRGRKAPLEPLDVVSEATLIFTAAAFGEAAKESDELKHDVYTHFLLEALKDGDRDGDGAITATEAHDYARGRTYQFTGGAQRPTAEAAILGEDPIVLKGRRTRAPLPVIYSYAASAEGLRLRVDGRDKGMLPGGIAIEEGEHYIELSDGTDVLYAGDISLTGGQRVELSKLIPPGTSFVVSIGPSSFIPLGADVRRELVPIAFGGGVRALMEHLLFEGTVIGAAFDVRAASGSTSGFGERVPFDFFSFGVKAMFGWGFALRDELRLRATFDLGAFRLHRAFDTDTFTATQSTAAFSAGPRAELLFRTGSWLELALGAGGGVFFARFGEETGAHGYTELSITAGTTL